MHRSIWAVVAVLSCGAEIIPVGRNDASTIKVVCNGGINQNPETAEPNECADALNVWAPDGRVVSRPGYVGYTGRLGQPTSNATSAVLVRENPAGTYAAAAVSGGSLSLNSLPTGSRWLVGINSAPSTWTAIQITVSATNTASTRYKPEYWNGTTWRYLHVWEAGGSSTTNANNGIHLSAGSGASTFLFAPPGDWATTTITVSSTDYTRYWLRFTILDNALDGSVTLDNGAGTAIKVGANEPARGLFAFQFPSTKRYLAVFSSTGSSPAVDSYVSSTDLSLVFDRALSNTTLTSYADPANGCIVPQFEEAFVAYGYSVTRHKAFPTAGEAIAAQVETADFAVGPEAPYDDAYIPQLSTFPAAKYIQFFKGQLWAANLQGEPYTVRWSAPQPYHKVWPELSNEVIAEHDNSPITGLAPLGEYMYVFKNDSIWAAYDTGLDAFGLQTYALRQVVNGVGCVSHGSVKAIRGNLVFLAEDGVYSFDGNNVTKRSDKLNETFGSITPGRRPFASAAHWRSKNMYLLSFTTDGSTTHDTTVAWDYAADTWWIWDNIDAQHWLEDEGPADEETLYFGDSKGRVYLFGVGQTDHGGAITSTVTTHRLGYGENAAIRCRHVWALCSNKTRSVSVEVLSNDEFSGSTATLPFTDSAEADWTSFSYASGATTDDNWTPGRRRLKRADFRKDGDWVQVKLSHSSVNQPFELAYLDVGFTVLGRAR